MARKSQDLKRVEARDNELAAQIEQLERELEVLRDERKKVQTAREVLEELSGIPPQETEGNAAADFPDLPPVTPEQTLADVQEFADLTVGDMALAVLKDGPPDGCTSSQILEAIHARWTPNLQRSSLSPPLSRLKKKGAIDLVGERWQLVGGNEGDT